ncbi:hypothetical protein SLEP1_g28652 [Rubroshorea leprosula]|uniref:Transposase (putative) gypsy type domain-containing protein n=1 Tax=Rubroshorea leprosula TaxID=152421 RepID=A0AAV5K1G9_9ROSI|nr:hypothetical protein SLEP1_g28652 [Rubroshorea leprosula]
MDSLREPRELRGNQGREEEEEEGVISAEPITMIVPPELQDLPETMALESSTSSSARDNGGDHPTASSSSSSSEETPSREEGTGDVVGHVSDRPVVGEWESRMIMGRISNLRKAPKDLPAGFRFRVALHHEVADCAPSISGYRRLEEMVGAYHIPKTILLLTGGQNERACIVSQTGWILVYVDHFDAGLRFPLPGLVFDLIADYELALTQLMPNSIRFIIGFMLLCVRLEVPAKAIVFRSLFQCRMCPNSRGAKWYYLSGREKSQLFKNVRNKVARWKRQFIFVRDTRTERISNDLTARLFEWRVPNAHVNYPQLLPRDIDLKNRLLEHARSENLIDLKALVTPELLAVFGRDEQHTRAPASASPGLTSSSHRGLSSASRPRADHRAEVVALSARRRAREETKSEDEVPLIRRRTSGGTQLVEVARPAFVRSPTAWAAAEPASTSASVSGPRIAYPEGFSYVRAECQPTMVQGMHSFVPPADSKRAKAFVQQNGGQVAMIKLMDEFSYAVAFYKSEQGARTQNSKLGSKCKQLVAEKASLVDDVNRLQGSEMANRAAAAESRADELANRNNELREELEHQVAEDDQNLTAAGESLNELKTSHARSVSIARAQGAEWFVGLAAFQDAVVVAFANVTTKIYNEIRGKVLQHRLDFPIGELAFFDGEDLDEQGKSLAPIVDATVRLRWDLNEEGPQRGGTSTRRDLNKEGVPVWPPQVLEDGEDPTRLPSFDAWVEGAPVAEQEPSSTPPSSQLVVVPASSPVNAPASEPVARSPPTRSPAAAADASIPVDLTDD